VFVIVAVDAQQFPVAAIRRVVVMVVVLMVHGKFAQLLAAEFPAAPGTNPGVNLEGLLAIRMFPVSPRFSDQLRLTLAIGGCVI
jgi:hypothetical protein